MAAGTIVSPMHSVPVKGSPLQVTVKIFSFSLHPAPFATATPSSEDTPVSATNPARTKASNSTESTEASTWRPPGAARPTQDLSSHES